MYILQKVIKNMCIAAVCLLDLEYKKAYTVTEKNEDIQDFGIHYTKNSWFIILQVMSWYNSLDFRGFTIIMPPSSALNVATIEKLQLKYVRMAKAFTGQYLCEKCTYVVDPLSAHCILLINPQIFIVHILSSVRA